ncbi:MAG: aminoglycoside phosphotransferase [Alphaproteobacteria bacterium]|nr:aminoglycoside phosphotransferase [Alphaproteobacteria bacterium]
MRDENLFAGTGSVREAHRFDETALARWMEANIAGCRGPLSVEQFKGGQSNPTYKLITPARSYVLRRKPPGQLLKGAHAVEREARVMRALGQAGFPVPHVHALCDDEDVIGTPFFVMDMVEGRIFWSASIDQVPRNERPAYFDAMNATIAQLPSIAPEAIGLADYGRAGDYFVRQISRW